jgi:hypothetical protein
MSLVEMPELVSVLLPSRLSINRYLNLLHLFDFNVFSYIAPASPTKPLQEERKKVTKEKLVIEIAKPLKKDVFLPDIFEIPSFMGAPLIINDDKGMTKFN